ncbi:MAG: response regulator [Chloroherpetonaceae bacterium]|nr:response regulator [Chloroherpetonaceae bacterium]MDW8436699.1 response regulator [Chloroherpetonaceae bacterium]
MSDSVRMLIVEDNPVDAQLFRATLSPLSLDIDVVSDGNAAFERLKSHSYDLALMDLLLPNASGLELLRRAEREGVTLPLTIVCSAISGENYVMECLKLGASGYLIKPVTGAQLLAAIHDCLSLTAPRAATRLPVELAPPVAPLSLTRAMAEMTYSRGTGQILAQTPDGVGALEYLSGKLASARFKQLSGIEALEKLRSMRDASIVVQRVA